MKSIYKYPLSVVDIQVVLLPVGSDILTVQMQGSQPCLWALVDKNEQRIVSRHIETHGTGHDVSSPNLKYISTFQINEYSYNIETLPYSGLSIPQKIQTGVLVYHVFEELN